MFIDTTKRMFLAHWKVVGIVLVLFAASVAAFLVWNKPAEEDILIVTAKPFVQEVSVSGKVQALNEVDMTFEETGRVSRVYVEVGDEVSVGDPLIELASDGVQAQLASAQAEVTMRRVERANQGVSLEEITSEQDTKVQSAYFTLLSKDLAAIAESSTYTVTPPVITGLYEGGVEGTYRLSVRRATTPGFYELYVFGLETTGAVRVSKTGPTPLGTKGLYVTFPDPVADYRDTRWNVEIPNQKSTSYLASYNAYQEALRERTRTIEEAQSQLERRSEGLTIADAMLASAQAEVRRLTAELNKRTLRAPFDGTVTLLDLSVGDTVSPSVPAVSLMSTNTLEVESFVPEINISYLEVGDPAVVTLDAYGELVPFAARVIAIDPAETTRDGVSTYRVRLQFVEEDARLRSGMTANIVITTDEREGVISVPQGAVTRTRGTASVRVKIGEETETRTVTTGAVSSLGEIEIIEGLEEGDRVVLRN